MGILFIVVTSRAELPDDADLFAPYEVIGELGARPTPVYVARQSALAVGGAQLVVAEHFPGACRPSEIARSDLRREARRISTLANPHLSRVREVAVRGDDLVVFGDFLDGEKLGALWKSGEWIPVDIGLRVLLDVLTGIGALHGLRDSNQQPMKLVHGELSPSTILVGSDGVGRVLHAVARRAIDGVAEDASLPYLAPEVYANDAHDGRADVFSVGVLLWELLANRPLTSDGEEAAGVRVRSAALEAPEVSEKTPWAKALIPVVAKALAAAPEDRWSTAAVMAAEIRKGAGLKLAAASAAAAYARNKFGERVKQRRARWESRPSQPPGTVSSPRLDASASRAESEASLARLDSSAPATSPVFEVPSARSEEFSSSVLESFRPPAPPTPAAAPAPASAQMPVSRVAQAVFASMPDVDSLAAWDDPPTFVSPGAPALTLTPAIAPSLAMAPAPAMAPVIAPAPAPAFEFAHSSAPTPAIAHASAFDRAPSSAPVPSSAPTRVDPLGTTHPAGPVKEAAPKDSAISIPPLAALTAGSIPEPPPSAETAVPYEAPVVFDDAEAAPIAAPLGDRSPFPPALSSSGAPSRSRRRKLVLAGVAALSIAAVSVVAVRAHRGAAVTAPVVAAAVAPPVTTAPGAASAAIPAASSTTPPDAHGAAASASASSAAPATGAAAPAHAGKKAAPKKPAGPAHTKAAPVRPQSHAKP